MKATILSLVILGSSSMAAAQGVRYQPNYDPNPPKSKAPQKYCRTAEAQTILDKIARVTKPGYPATHEQLSHLSNLLIGCHWTGSEFRTPEGLLVLKSAQDDLVAKSKQILAGRR